MLLFLNLPLIGIWVKVLKVPFRFLFPLILLFCLIGSYSVNQRPFDVVLMAGFGLVGYLLRKLDYEPAPLVLAFVLGPLLENALRQSLILSDGSFAIFISRPISAIALGICLFLIASAISPRLRKTKKKLEVDLG
jgi:putative tricarboxylic transport membrane protein